MIKAVAMTDLLERPSSEASFGPTLSFVTTHRTCPYKASRATSTTDEDSDYYSYPSSRSSDSILPSARQDFLLGLPKQEVQHILSPVKNGFLSDETAFSIRDARSDSSVAISAMDLHDMMVSSDLEEPEQVSKRRWRPKTILLVGIIAALFFCLLLTVSSLVAYFALRDRDGEHGPTAAPPSSLMSDIKILSFGGLNGTLKIANQTAVQVPVLDSIEQFHPFDPEKCRILPQKLSIARFAHATLLIDDLVYIVGGVTKVEDQLVALRSVEIFNISSGELSTGPNTTEPRAKAAATVFNSSIIICGGYKNLYTFESMDSCELLTPNSSNWTQIQPMTKTRAAHGLTIFEGSIWAMGGFTNSTAASDGSCEEIGTDDQWMEQGRMLLAQANGDVSVYGRDLVLCGGVIYDGEKPASIVNCQKLDSNFKWHTFPTMRKERASLQLLHLPKSNQLLAIGGASYGYSQNATGTEALVEESVEIYDHAQGRWHIIESKMILPRYSFGAVVIGENA